jgi:hypothetical protein
VDDDVEERPHRQPEHAGDDEHERHGGVLSR